MKPKSEIQKTPSSDLRQILKGKDDDRRALAKYVSQLSIRKIHESQTEGRELEIAIDYIRQQYFKIREYLEDHPEDQDKARDLQYLHLKEKEYVEQHRELNVARTIRELSTIDEDAVIRDLTLLIIDVDEAFNVGDGLDVPQIETLAFGLVDKMGFMTLDDVALCFDQAKGGAFGTVFNRIDVGVVNSWLKQYWEGRKALYVQAQQDRHLGSKYGMSYDPQDKQSVIRVSKDRGINTDDETYYQAFKEQVRLRPEAREKRLDQKLSKSKM